MVSTSGGGTEGDTFLNRALRAEGAAGFVWALMNTFSLARSFSQKVEVLWNAFSLVENRKIGQAGTLPFHWPSLPVQPMVSVHDPGQSVNKTTIIENWLFGNQPCGSMIIAKTGPDY